MTDDWRITENLYAVALSTGWLWHRAVSSQAMRILASDDQISQQVDVLMLTLALRQVVRAATLAKEEARGPNAAAVLDDALTEFDQQLPGAVRARDALEHFDDYLRGVGHHQQPTVKQSARRIDEDLASRWRPRFRSGEDNYVYLVGNLEIDVKVARQASSTLLSAIHRAGNMTD